MNVCFGVSTKAVTPSASVSAVTMPGVKGSGKEIYAVTQQNATQSAIFVISLAVKSIRIPPNPLPDSRGGLHQGSDSAAHASYYRTAIPLCQPT